LTEIAGASPSAIFTGAPPVGDAAQIVTMGWTGDDAGSGARFPSAGQFAS